MIYGTALRADSLSNVPLNGRMRVAIVFTAKYSVPVNKIRLTSPIRTGYTAGTGGDIRVALEGVDDTLGDQVGYIAFNNTDPYAEAVMAPLVPLVAGLDYRIVISNEADDPVNNWRSVDGFFVTTADPLDPPQQVFLQAPGQPWQPHATNVPMWQVEYLNGHTQGNGYVDCVNGAAVTLANGVRELITPSQTMTFDGGAIALRGLVSEGTISIVTASGSLVSVPLRVPAIPNGWSRFDFPSPVTLVAGTTYYLVPQGSGSAVPLQKGWSRASDGVTIIYTYGPETFFNEGRGQQMVAGAWSDWISEQGAADPRLDLQFQLWS